MSSNLDKISGPSNLASGDFFSVRPSISNCSNPPLELREETELLLKAGDFSQEMGDRKASAPESSTWSHLVSLLLKEIGIADHLTCVLRNLYAGQEATVRTGHGTTDWF